MKKKISSFKFFLLIVLPLIGLCCDDNGGTNQYSVQSTNPNNGATDVDLDQLTITATFSKSLDPTSVTTSTFIVKEGENPVNGTVSYNSSTKTVQFTFTEITSLSQDTTYQVTLKGGSSGIKFTETVVKTASDGSKTSEQIPLSSDYTWSFSTTSNIESISISPTDKMIGYESPQQYTATAKYDGGKEVDITNTASWSCSNPNAGSINASGLFTPNTPHFSLENLDEETTISASKGGKIGSITVTVSFKY